MPACRRLTKVAGTKQDQVPAAGAGGLCSACASCGSCHNYRTAQLASSATQPASSATASPVTLIFAALASTPGEVSFGGSALLCLRPGPQSGSAGGGNQSHLPGPWGVPVLLLACSEMVNHPELLTGFVILNMS